MLNERYFQRIRAILNILLLECTTRKIEFAYYKNGKFIILNVLETEKNADSLLYVMREEFRRYSFGFDEIDIVGLSNGPGSFTGLRIGSAVAKGICFAGKSRLIEIVTLDIIGGKCKHAKNFTEKNSSRGEEFTALIFSNSRTGEFYSSRYKKDGSGITRVSDYKLIKTEDLISYDIKCVINEKIDFRFPENLTVIDVSGESGMVPFLELVKERVVKEEFDDYRTSEPFYMKTFVPLKTIKC